jgi:hypothetical protein
MPFYHYIIKHYLQSMKSIIFLIVFASLISIVIRCKSLNHNVNNWHYRDPEDMRVVCSRSCMLIKG